MSLEQKRDVTEQLLAYCRRLNPGTWGLRDVPQLSPGYAKGARVAIMRLDTWSDPFTKDGDPVAGVVHATSSDWATLLAGLPREAVYHGSERR